MSFTPETIALHEAGPTAEYKWLLTEPLTWSGDFHGGPRHLEVPTSPPFETDLASVPRCLTWLFPRYGKYTKAAVVHDFLCQHFADEPPSGTRQPLLPLRDRSDADEVFRALMTELEVPWLRRTLMWGAVSWATLFTSLVPGRGTVPAVLRWIGRLLASAAILGAFALVIAQHDGTALWICAIGLPAALLVAGTIALGRADRVGASLFMYPLTLFFAPLLAPAAILSIIVVLFVVLEDVFGQFATTRRVFGRSDEAKLRRVATPQFARLTAVMES